MDRFAAALSQRLALGNRGGVTENRVWRGVGEGTAWKVGGTGWSELVVRAESVSEPVYPKQFL